MKISFLLYLSPFWRISRGIFITMLFVDNIRRVSRLNVDIIYWILP